MLVMVIYVIGKTEFLLCTVPIHDPQLGGDHSAQEIVESASNPFDCVFFYLNYLLARTMVSEQAAYLKRREHLYMNTLMWSDWLLSLLQLTVAA